MPQPHQKRRPQRPRSAQPNKAQKREAQVRAEQMAAEPSPEVLDSGPGLAMDEVDAVPEPSPDPVVRRPGTTSASVSPSKRRTSGERSRRAIVAAPAPAATREQEYAFIRADMRRLLITAGAVLVLMLALLFVVEG